MKKLIREKPPEPKKREVSKKWTFSEEYYNYDKQMKLINEISVKNLEKNLEKNLDDEIIETVTQEINKKILPTHKKNKLRTLKDWKTKRTRKKCALFI